jgi:3-isopropylmalate/(R)-2-methylmalate dehydratase small subunit
VTAPFTTLRAIVVPLDRADVDTDAIIPKQFMKSIHRTGFGDNLFDEWRYLDRGEPGQAVSTRPKNPDFPLNQPCYSKAQILLARENFGCDSSREHALWALRDYGIRALIAPSFADIFYGNCFKNGMLPIGFDTSMVEALFRMVDSTPGMHLSIDLEAQTVTLDGGAAMRFEIGADRKHRLLNGLDDIDITLQHADLVLAYEAQRRPEEPWLFP